MVVGIIQFAWARRGSPRLCVFKIAEGERLSNCNYAWNFWLASIDELGFAW
jgi:hypothetical protein